MWEQLWSGTENWLTEFPRFYEASWPFVDAVVFMFMFVGLARVVFEKRFPGRGGKSLIIGVGLSMTVGMVLAEVEYGFSLRSFGSFAMVIVALLLVMTLYQSGRAFGLGKTASVSLVAFAGLPILSQILPGLGNLISGVLPLVLLIWLGSAVLTGTNGWHSRSREIPKLSGNTSSIGFEAKDEQTLTKLDKEEKTEGKKAYRHSKHILKILRRIRSDLKKEGLSPKGREEIKAELKKLGKEEHELVAELARLHELVHKVWSEGERVYRQVKVSVRQASGRQRKGMKRAADDIRKELTLQQALETLGARFRQFDSAFRQAIYQSVRSIERGRAEETVRWVDHAISWEIKAQQVLGEVRHAQKKAHAVLRREIRDLEAVA